MQERLRGNEFRTTVVCVDSYDRDTAAPVLYGGESLFRPTRQ